MSWAEERRADRVAKAEQDRKDLDARAERRIRERDAIAEQARRDEALRLEQDTAALAQRREERKARWAAVREWVGVHVVDLLIYPLAIASAVMAVPSMATYGIKLYGNATGAVLPVLSELGMWAFAVAVTLSRQQHPDRPVWALQLGILTFAASGFAINLGDGLEAAITARLSITSPGVKREVNTLYDIYRSFGVKLLGVIAASGDERWRLSHEALETVEQAKQATDALERHAYDRYVPKED